MENKFYILGLLVALTSSTVVQAAQVEMNTAQMQAMDKITGRVSLIEVPVGGEISFGTFSVVVRSCQARTEDEIPENMAFVDVTDKSFDQEEYNIFKGWMFSSSPSVHAVEHPIYDVWLLKCLDTKVAPERLLSAEALTAHDALPSLQQIRKDVQEQKPEELLEPEQQTIHFENSIYHEEPQPQPTPTQELPAPAELGAPQNLLNIDENYMPMPDEETVMLPADEFSAAVAAEKETLKEENASQNALKAAIDAELEEYDAPSNPSF